MHVKIGLTINENKNRNFNFNGIYYANHTKYLFRKIRNISADTKQT